MSPRTKEQFEELRVTSKRQILDASLELFANRGFDGTSVSEIAKAAGISKGLIYNYFPSKEALLEAIIREGLAELESSMAVMHTIDDPAGKLEAGLRSVIANAAAKPTRYRLFNILTMLPGVTRLFGDELNNYRKGWVEYIESLLSAIGHKEPFYQACLLGSLLDGLMINYFENPAWPLAELTDVVIQQFCYPPKKGI